MFPPSKKNAIEYLQAPLLSECDFLVHAFCTRIGGVSQDDYKSLNMSFQEGDEEFRVLANWDKLSAVFEIPMENFLVLNQVHGDNIFVIKPYGDYFTSREALNYDAMVTTRTNLAICIKTADCVPVFIVDRIKKVIAAVHAGWRGSALGISAKVVRLMQNSYDSQPQDLLAAIGPSIGPCCYEVDLSTADAFRRQKNAEDFLFPGKRKTDGCSTWWKPTVARFLIAVFPTPTFKQQVFAPYAARMLFSHRGSGGITGRQINFMMIKGDPPCRVLTVDDDLRQLH
ncbi:MAG: peptidoglycan editing factor PgeF [Desulfosudis oleivorans]|nr:peptidoglycan editing factor PgeF [Desulfosudis oleivorans]